MYTIWNKTQEYGMEYCPNRRNTGQNTVQNICFNFKLQSPVLLLQIPRLNPPVYHQDLPVDHLHLQSFLEQSP